MCLNWSIGQKADWGEKKAKWKGVAVDILLQFTQGHVLHIADRIIISILHCSNSTVDFYASVM